MPWVILGRVGLKATRVFARDILPMGLGPEDLGEKRSFG